MAADADAAIGDIITSHCKYIDKCTEYSHTLFRIDGWGVTTMCAVFVAVETAHDDATREQR